MDINGTENKFPGGFRFNHYGTFLKVKFGRPVFKIMVDGGFTCPNRDGVKGVGGCIYCNNDAFTVGIIGSGLPVSEQVKLSLEKKSDKKRYRDAGFLVYFQKYTNTYGPPDYLLRVYREALVSDRVVGIVVGTRPDCISEEIVSVLSEISRSTHVSVELGVQSVSDEVLREINRGHGYEELTRAAGLLSRSGIEFGAHMIYGLPGDSLESFVEGAKRLSTLGTTLVKLNHIHVVRGTELARLFEDGLFSPPTYDEYLSSVCDFIEYLSPGITVARLISTTPDKFLIAPKWDMGSGRFVKEVSDELGRRGTHQGSKSPPQR